MGGLGPPVVPTATIPLKFNYPVASLVPTQQTRPGRVMLLRRLVCCWFRDGCLLFSIVSNVCMPCLEWHEKGGWSERQSPWPYNDLILALDALQSVVFRT